MQVHLVLSILQGIESQMDKPKTQLTVQPVKMPNMQIEA